MGRQGYRAVGPQTPWSGTIVGTKRVLDGRNALDRDAWTAAGWTYRALDRRAG
jgi:UDPglucose 6-dehydrogenase